MKRAEKRLGQATPGKPRRDRGQSRLPAELAAELNRLLQGQERPPVRSLLRQLEAFCTPRGLAVPARATIYAAMAQAPTPGHEIAELSPAVRETLYNLAAEGPVPGHQLAFHCLNYGSTEAICFAAGLPWLALYQAARVPGWRPRSRGLLEAVLRVRRI